MKKTTLLASAVVLALLSGCSSKDANEHYSDALNFIQQKQYNSAVIELKSAVQQAPDNGEYRLALGLLQLQIGDSASAEKELTRALSLNMDINKVALPLIRSSYQSGNYQGVLALFAETPLASDLQIYVDVYHALAHLELGSPDETLNVFSKQAEQTDFPDVASYAQAHLAIANRQNEKALEIISSVSAQSPLYAEALFLQGRTHLAEEEYVLSAESFRNYLAIVPNNLQARLMLAQSLISTDQFDSAEKELTLLLKVAPNQSLANYLKASLEFERQNYTLAKEHAEKALSAGFRAPSGYIVAALSSYHLKLNSQALNHLSAIEKLLPQFPQLNNLYVALQLDAGQLDKATSNLTNLGSEQLDANVLAATTYQLFRKGSVNNAKELIAKYESADNKDASSLSTVGLIKMSLGGQDDSGIRDLEAALKLDPNHEQTRFILALSYLRQGQYDKAHETLEEWLNHETHAVTAYNLKAYIALKQENSKEAGEMLAKAEQAKADNPFTYLLKSLYHESTNDLDAAKKTLAQATDKHPGYTPAHQQYYALTKADDNGADAIKRAQVALKKEEANNGLRTVLARMHHQQGQYKEAVEVLKAPSLNESQAPISYWLMLIDSHAKLGNSKEAQAISERWYQLDPNNVQAGYYHATSLNFAKRHVDALNVLDKLLLQFPKNTLLLRSKVMTLVESKEYSKALDTIKQLPEADSKTAEMLTLKGRALFLNGQIPPAVTAFTESYQLDPNDKTAMFLAEIYAKDYSHQRAREFLDTHFHEHGASGNLKLFYANLLLESDKTKAFKLYEEILETSPDNYIILNNYAWVLAEDNKLEDAQKNIEKALKSAPKHPDVLDTYGKVLMKMDKLPDAVKAFEQSLSIRPANDVVKLNYAEALARSNNASKAKSVLAEVKSRDSDVLKRISHINSLLP